MTEPLNAEELENLRWIQKRRDETEGSSRLVSVNIDRLLATIANRDKTIAALAPFAWRILERVWEGGDFDGGDLQELAVSTGILIETEMTEACSSTCACAEVDDFPQTCYRLAPNLREVLHKDKANA